MNPFSPALRELARVLGRQPARLRLFLARRELAKAETNLGLLGWQQAYFTGESQRQIESITDFEREQVRLTNESARLGLLIHQAQEAREAARGEFEADRAILEAERLKVASPVAEKERELAARQALQAKFAERTALLEKEMEEANRRHRELLDTARRSAETRGEMIRLRDRAAIIPTELADIRDRQGRLANEMRPIEAAVAAGRAAVAVEDEKLRAREAEFEAADGARRKEISDCEREKQAAESENESLEKAKGNHYRKIGQVLADGGIAPMNQPGALAGVEHARGTVARILHEIASSLEASAGEDRAALRMSWCVWAVVGLTLAVVLLIARH